MAAVVAYNADSSGLYVPANSATRIPRIRGVCVTNALGQFAFSTVRPGPYPSGDEPAHIHLVVTAPAHRPRFVTYWFAGDPLITAAKREKAARDPEIVIVSLARQGANDWTFTHDIKLEAD
jgi:protocatechuate 3,4-dioxygenase beta subunit